MNLILITAHLVGLRMVMQLIILSSYKKKLIELLTLSHVILTLVVYSKKIFILKFLDKVNLENTLFVSKSIYNVLPSLFNDWFLFSSEQHNYETSWSYHGSLHKLSYKTDIYGKNYIVVSAINAWSNSQKLLQISPRHFSLNKIKKTFFAKY